MIKRTFTERIKRILESDCLAEGFEVKTKSGMSSVNVSKHCPSGYVIVSKKKKDVCFSFCGDDFSPPSLLEYIPAENKLSGTITSVIPQSALMRTHQIAKVLTELNEKKVCIRVNIDKIDFGVIPNIPKHFCSIKKGKVKKQRKAV